MEGSGSLPDGAFERFVTSAIAAIITIVFSWRLLAEGQEQLEGTNRPRPPRIVHEIASEKEKEKEKPKQPALDIPIDEDIQQVESNNVLASAPKYATLNADGDRKHEEIDSPSWGDYKWEEDMYDTVHTRRNVNDFVVKRSSESSSDEHDMDSDIQLSPIPASHEMLEKLYMNQEYRSIVDDEGLSDSSCDSDENATEGVYEPPNVEQDMFYANGLEPIMEEDSDDLDSSENENDNDDDINENEDVCESENRTYSEVTSDNEPEGTRQDLVKHEEVNHQKDINASLTDADDDTSSLPDLADDNQFILDNFIDECFDNCGEDYDNISDKTDSLPPSPIIRTRAIDEEYANLSDESCSSGSVITVVSVKSDYSDTPEIQIVEDSNKPLSFIYNDNESNIPDNLQGEDIIAFIHGSEEKQDYDFDLNKTPDNDMCNEFVDDEIKKSAPQKNELDYEDFIRDIQAVSETNNSPENAQTNEHVDENVDERKNDETDGEFTQNMCVDLFIKEDTEHLCAIKSENTNQDCPSDDTFKLFEKSNGKEEKIFDDDEGPREYNPYEDDFAEFDYCDSDDDSFYLVMGESNNLPNFKTFNNADSGNLRNFDTFDNLDAVGLSPGLDSSCESGLSDDGRFIFSRTEDISTEYRTRFYIKDREMDYETKNIHVDTCETEVVNKPEVDSVIENKNSYNESKLQNADSCDPIISDLENIELFIDESRIAENSCSAIENIDSNNELTIVDKVFSGINSAQSSPANNEEINNSVVDTEHSDEMSIPIVKNDSNEISTDDGLSPSSEEISEVSLEKGEHGRISESSSFEKLNTKPFPENSYESSEENSQISCENGEFENSLKPCIEILSRAHDSGIDLDSDSSKLDITDDSNKPPSLSKKFEILDLIHTVKGQIDRSSSVKPSLFKGGTKTRTQQQKQKQRSKSYVSVLQQPMSPETTRSVAVVLPERNVPKSRQQIIASRKRFLSEQNLLSDDMQEKFQHHKTSFEQVSQRKPRYLRRGNSLPRSSRNRKSYEKLDFNSLNSSRSSVEKPEICTLHENCIFSPQKHQEILNRTLSIENLEFNLMRYGSVTSLVETDIDSGETTEYQVFTDFENDFEFQLPLERTASMSELGTRKKNKTETKGRFSDRNVPKSKSLCTLETNIDDVDETPQPGTLGRVPSVHELRVTKSLQKLNIPDWYKKSSVSRSGSTWSLYSTPRKDSFSSYNYPPSITSSPCPSVSLGSNSVVIRTRVTPSSAKLFRSPKLQTTPEKSPTPICVQLPSEKLRQKEKPKELMPIPIVPFTKLRLMFEENSRRLKPTSLATKPSSTSPVATPTTPVSPTVVDEIKISQPTVSTEQHMTKPSVPAKPILKKKKTTTTSENKNVVRVEPQQATPVSVQPMSTSPRSGRRVETTFNGSVGQTEKRQFKNYGVFKEKMNTMNDCPVLTIRSQHSGVRGGDFHDFSLKENNPLNIKSQEKDKKIVLNKFNSEYKDILHRKCKSLEDVIDGLLAMEKNTTYSENSLTEEKLLTETRSPNLYTDSKRKQCVDPSSPVFSTELSLDTPGEFYCDANKDTVLDEFVTCVNCQRCTYLRDARNIYKRCYYCQTWYCSRQCRVNNWNIHTTFCIVGRMADICKRVFKFCNKNLEMQFLLSNVAIKGFLTEGRGCVKLTFTDIGSAENFCCFGLSHIQESPNYISWKNFENESQNSYHTLPALCTASKKYNPDLKYILVVSFLIRNGLSVENFSGRSFFKKCAILRLCSFHLHSKPEQEIETSSILILTASPRNVNSFHKEERHARETCFIDIQRKLCERGVDLRHQYPKLYRKLIDFVADGKYFSPIIFHPFDVKMDKCFTCIIVAESEPEIEWLPESNQFNRF